MRTWRSRVTIRNNTNGLSNVTPSIIPVSNSNGVAISDISFDISSKNVTVGFDTGFSDQSPFAVGDKVLIENISVGVDQPALDIIPLIMIINCLHWQMLTFPWRI